MLLLRTLLLLWLPLVLRQISFKLSLALLLTQETTIVMALISPPFRKKTHVMLATLAPLVWGAGDNLFLLALELPRALYSQAPWSSSVMDTLRSPLSMKRRDRLVDTLLIVECCKTKQKLRSTTTPVSLKHRFHCTSVKLQEFVGWRTQLSIFKQFTPLSVIGYRRQDLVIVPIIIIINEEHTAKGALQHSQGTFSQDKPPCSPLSVPNISRHDWSAFSSHELHRDPIGLLHSRLSHIENLVCKINV